MSGFESSYLCAQARFLRSMSPGARCVAQCVGLPPGAPYEGCLLHPRCAHGRLLRLMCEGCRCVAQYWARPVSAAPYPACFEHPGS